MAPKKDSNMAKMKNNALVCKNKTNKVMDLIPKVMNKGVIMKRQSNKNNMSILSNRTVPSNVIAKSRCVKQKKKVLPLDDDINVMDNNYIDEESDRTEFGDIISDNDNDEQFDMEDFIDDDESTQVEQEYGTDNDTVESDSIIKSNEDEMEDESSLNDSIIIKNTILENMRLLLNNYTFSNKN